MFKKPLCLCVFVFALSGCMTLEQFSFQDTENPTDPKGIKVADAILKNGNVETAVGIYARLLEKQPLNEDLWLRYASASYKLGAYRRALVGFEKLSALNENGCSASVGMGKVHLKLGRPTVAGSYFKQCLVLNEEHEEALVGRAISYDVSGRSDLALSFYQRAMFKKPQDIGLINNYGLSLMMAGDPAAAITEFGKIAFSGYSTVKIRQNLALAYGLTGDMRAAEQVAALDLSPELVVSNLKIYEHIRHLPGNSGLKSILFGGAGP